MVKKIIISGLTIIGLTSALNANIKIANKYYEYNSNYNYVKLKSLNNGEDEFNRIIPCSNIPKKIYIKDKWFANLKDYQIIVCDNFIYKADTKRWYIKK